MSGAGPHAEALIEEGLRLYGAGQLDQALDKWREALRLVPDIARAQDYIHYVDQNRVALEESFRSAHAPDRGAPPAGDAAHVPERVHPEQAGGEEDLQIQIDVLEEVDWDEQVAEQPPEPDIPIELDDPQDAGQPLEPEPEQPRPAAASAQVASAMVKRAERQADRQAQRRGPKVRDDDTERILIDEYEEHRREVALREGREDADESPLQVLDGGGKEGNDDFEPLELTPVGVGLPEPSRLVPLAGDGRARVELTADDRTPASLGSSANASAEGRTRLSTPATFAEPPRRARVVTRETLRQQDSSPSGPIFEAGHATPAPPAEALPADSQSDLPVVVPPTPPRSTPKVGGALAQLRTSGVPDRQRAAVAVSPVAPSGAQAELQAGADAVPGEERVDSMLTGAWQLHEQGTFEGSLWLCQRILALEPNHGGAGELLERNRDALLHQYDRQLGDLQQVPQVLVPQREIVWHKLDHRAGFLLSRIDGMLSYAEILDISGMSRFETCRILAQLLEQRVIGTQR